MNTDKLYRVWRPVANEKPEGNYLSSHSAVITNRSLAERPQVIHGVGLDEHSDEVASVAGGMK